MDVMNSLKEIIMEHIKMTFSVTLMIKRYLSLICFKLSFNCGDLKFI